MYKLVFNFESINLTIKLKENVRETPFILIHFYTPHILGREKKR